jgi:outer membrane protein OmpA-like peptidoglycan-associated protein
MDRAYRGGGPNAAGPLAGPGSAGSPGKRTLTEQLVQWKAAPAGVGADAAAPAGAASPAIAALRDRVGGSPAALRSVLLAEPAMRDEVEAYFAAGGDPALDDLLARAFPPQIAQVAAPSADETVPEREKDPKDKKLPLPAARGDSKSLSRGVMSWKLQAITHSDARVDVDFLPDKTKVDAKNVSFMQTVLNSLGGSPLYAGASVSDPVGKKSLYAPFEEAKEKRRVDHAASVENDPFYGAEWDQAAKKWKNEGGGTIVGGSKKGVSSSSAKMNDNPGTGLGREGKGDTVKEFETVPVVLETREALGALKWGYKIEDKENAPIELTGATKADCTDNPSATWGSALDRFYEAKFEILDGFAQDKADLTPAHAGILDGIVTRLKAKSSLTAELGGAADLKDADPAKISQARADAAKKYLVSQGIDAGRITTQAYGADWAKVATTAGASEPKNRRVQIWVK